MINENSKISSDQLMHFVKKQEYLIQILNHNFYPRLCCEDAIKSLFKSDVYVPMKCFCDIPLNNLKEHMKTYGDYGVGFKKSWGEKVGLTPVIYYNENSPYIQNIKKVHNDWINRLNNSKDDVKRSEIVEVIRILKSSFTMYKPIYGEYNRISKSGNNYNFYNEREWRYLLPAISSTAYLQGNELPQYIIDDYNGVEKGGEWKKGKLELGNQIEFTYDDIDFVIIPSSCDRNEIIEELNVSSNVSLSDVEKIKNKIGTIEEIKKRNF